MFGIGLGEIIIIILIIFIISPKDLPKAMRKAGQFFNAINKIKNEIANIKSDVSDIVKEADIRNEISEIRNTNKKESSRTKK